VYLQFNQIHGPLPASLAELASLRHLCVSDNQLAGEAPYFLEAACPQLTQLLVHNNQLTHDRRREEEEEGGQEGGGGENAPCRIFC
jgi:hypothetical protein